MALAFESPMSQSIPKMDSSLQRPQSALARGVQITELSDGGTLNPSPVVMQETDILMEQYLSPTKLQLLTGSDNLDQVRSLELKVDTSETTLNNFGALLPNLSVLKLSGSTIPCIRDLGSSLRNLEVLWMSRCALVELDGVSSMLKLRELYLAYNEISDISPLSMLEELQILDLEGNNIEDFGQIPYLTLCTKLHHITLDGNPICITPTADAQETNYDYRDAVKKVLPNLLTLDDKSLAEDDTSSSQNVFDADWAYLEELQNDALLMESAENENETVAAAGRPTTAALRPATSFRPGSALRPSSGFRPTSASKRPASIGGGRPSSAWTEGSKKRPASSDAVDGVEASSDLTCGAVFCGNPSKALRERRKAGSSHESVNAEGHKDEGVTKAGSTGVHASHGGSRNGEEEKEEEEERVEGGSVEEKDLTHLLQELRSWKMEHEKRLEKIRESKAPQVFTIEHNSDSNLSDNESNHDVSDSEDLDFRPSSAMQQYQAQQRQLTKFDKLLASTPSTSAHNEEDEGVDAGLLQDEELGDGERFAGLSVADCQRLKQYEKSLDEDEKLLREYQRVLQLSKQQEGERRSSQEGRELRELRVPSAGRRPPAPPKQNAPRAPSPLMSPFGLMGDSPVSPRDRSRKTKIGPTGLPGSGPQPQIRDIITPPGKSGLGGLIGAPGPRPPSSSLQQRIRRQLPEVPPLPSRPPPVPKS